MAGGRNLSGYRPREKHTILCQSCGKEREVPISFIRTCPACVKRGGPPRALELIPGVPKPASELTRRTDEMMKEGKYPSHTVRSFKLRVEPRRSPKPFRED